MKSETLKTSLNKVAGEGEGAERRRVIVAVEVLKGSSRRMVSAGILEGSCRNTTGVH